MAGFKIAAVHAFVSIDPETGDEGVIGINTRLGWIPAISADDARLESLRPMVQHVCDCTGMQVRLIKLSGAREEVETLTPKGAGNA